MKRTVTAELLDTDQGTAEEVAASLADLRWFNRYFGGQSTTTHLLSRIASNTGEQMSGGRLAAEIAIEPAQIGKRGSNFLSSALICVEQFGSDGALHGMWTY